MLLSIVESSDHRLWGEKRKAPIKIKTHSNVEWIGPVFGPNVATMRNKGVEVAKGTWIFFKDEDCEVDVSRLLEVIKQLESSQSPYSVVGGIYKSRQQGILAKHYSRIQRKWVLSGLSPQKQKFISPGNKLLGGALLVKKQVFAKVNKGFCEEIGWGAEELEFVNRARQAGFETGVSYRLVVRHKNNLNLKNFFKRAWVQNFNRGFYQVQQKESWVTRRVQYFRSPISSWPSLVLFFGVGLVGVSSGAVWRGVKNSWK